MSSTANNDWHDANQRYLAVALEWLRLRLKNQAQQWQTLVTNRPAPNPSPKIEPAPPPQKHGFFRRTSVMPVTANPVVLPAPASSSPLTLLTDNEVAQKAAAKDAAESQMQSPPALVELANILGLSRFERDLLFLCVAMELDTGTATLCAQAQDDGQRPYPTFALALSLFDDEATWDVLSPKRPLRYFRLIEIYQPATQTLITSQLRADERIVNYVKGLEYVDERLTSLFAPLQIDENELDLPPSQQTLAEEIIRNCQRANAASSTPLPALQLVGPAVPSKQQAANYVAAKFNRHLCYLPSEMLPASAADLEVLARLWQRESALLPLALYLDAQETDSTFSGEGQGLNPVASSINRFLAHSKGLFFVGTRELWPRLGTTNLAFDVVKPTPGEQLAAWKETLGTLAPDSPALLASQFNLNLTAIRQIAQAALAEAAASEETLPDQLWNACKVSTRPRLDALAQRLDPKVTWDDLVLPDEEIDLLHQIADQVGQRSKVYEEWGFASKMNRGLGINALFAGESGTGKTMAAEVIANHLRLNLYRIDLSAVVSKYIGETEKNLRRLFDAAEDGAAILFFDEADALFGKRSEVKDSHDRYANIEINYLLQRMEAYRGLAILATNMKSALDTAFMRRLRFIVNCPFPGVPERKRMWQKVFPTDTPVDDEMDYDRLARLNLTGGSISSIAINAAFLAAQAATPVTMPLVLAAARIEYRKQDRLINEADFRLQVPQGARA